MKITKGMKFRSIIADCNALWETVKPSGKNNWLCRVVNEPVEYDGKTYEGDWAGHEDVFMNSAIETSVNHQKIIKEMESDHDKFYASLVPGQIVHYHGGFGDYERCKVVKEGGTNKLVPIALIGNRHKLPQRMADGSIYYPYAVKKIMEQAMYTPNYGNIFEHDPKSFLSRGYKDPRKMEPVSLEVPEMTEEEEKQAKLHRVAQQAVAILSSDNDPMIKLEMANDLISRMI